MQAGQVSLKGRGWEPSKRFAAPGRLCANPVLAPQPQVVVLFWARHVTEASVPPRAVSVAFLAPGGKFWVSHLHVAAQGASLGAGLAAGDGRQRQRDSKDGLFSCWRSSSLSRQCICAEAAAAVAVGAAQRQSKVFWPCCEPGSVCVLVLSDPRLPPCYPIPLLSVYKWNIILKKIDVPAALENTLKRAAGFTQLHRQCPKLSGAPEAAKSNTKSPEWPFL